MNETTDFRKQRRQKRRRRRAIAIAGFGLLTLGLAWFFESQATTTIIVTRHADVTSLAAPDPVLSGAGERRARELAHFLGKVDVVAGVDAIYVAPNRRARETSVPLSMLNDVPVHTIEKPDDVETLVNRILREYKGKIVLIIMDAEHIQPVIAEMHGSKKLPEFGENEYDNVYVVSIPWFGKVKTLRLQYGETYVPDESDS